MNKDRARVLFLLAAVVCLASGPPAFGQEREPWQEDWQKFGEAIAPYAREGALEPGGDAFGFNRAFSKEVEWAGALRGFHSYGVAKFLILEMPPIRVPLRGGGEVEVSSLSVSCRAEGEGCGGWSKELIGKQVVFRTLLNNRTKGIRAVVRVETRGVEKPKVRIETDGAELIRVIRE